MINVVERQVNGRGGALPRGRSKNYEAAARHRRRRARGWQPADQLAHAQLQVGPLARSYWLAPAPQPPAPLIVAVHGSGTNGKDMAAFTGLAQRGPAAGFAVVFPDGAGQVWDGARRLPGRESVDDAGFIRALVENLVDDRTVQPWPWFLVGISNGALFVEHVARHGLVEPTGIVLVSGTTRATSRIGAARPRTACAVLSIQGTADPVMPYEGGRMGGGPVIGWLAGRRARQRGELAEDRVIVGAEVVGADWATANDIPSGPNFETFPTSERGLHVARLTWSAPGHRPVVLYRIEGGGHAWPGGPQYLPAWLVGRAARDFDATRVLLEMAREETGLSGGPASAR